MGEVGSEMAGVGWAEANTVGVGRAGVAGAGKGAVAEVAVAVLVADQKVCLGGASAKEEANWETEGADSGMVEVDWAMVEGGWGAASLVAMAEPRGAAKVAAKREGVARGEEEVPTVV